MAPSGPRVRRRDAVTSAAAILSGDRFLAQRGFAWARRRGVIQMLPRTRAAAANRAGSARQGENASMPPWPLDRSGRGGINIPRWLKAVHAFHFAANDTQA
jgi:hypothetical protein